MAAAVWPVTDSPPPQQQQQLDPVGLPSSSSSSSASSNSAGGALAAAAVGAPSSSSSDIGDSSSSSSPNYYYSDRDRILVTPTADTSPSASSSSTATAAAAAAASVAGSQSLILLHSSHPNNSKSTSTTLSQPRRRSQSGALPLKLSTNIISSDSSNSASNLYSPSSLFLLDAAVGTGSGRRKLKEFPGLIPLSRYFIPPSSASATPTATTPTVPDFGIADNNNNNNNKSKEVEKDTYLYTRDLDFKNDGTATPRNYLASTTREDAVERYLDKSNTTAGIPDAGFEPVLSPVVTSISPSRQTIEVAQLQQNISLDNLNLNLLSIDDTADYEMDQHHPPVAIIGDPEPLMTQDLLNFYKNRLHELEKSTQQELLERISVLRGFLLEHHDATNRLERQLHELQDENTSLSKELEDSIKHRVEMIALYKENEVLKEKLDQLSKSQELNQIYDPTPIPSPDPSVTGSIREKEAANTSTHDAIQTHYEDLISQLLAKFNEQASSRESERTLANQNIDQLNDRCKRLETAVSDSLKDIIQERSRRVGLEEKLMETEEELKVSVCEMQSQLEIFEQQINESRMSPVKDVENEDTDASEDILPPEMFYFVPDVASNSGLPPSALKRSQTASPTGSGSGRKTPSPTKRRTPSPTNGPTVAFALELKDSGMQTDPTTEDEAIFRDMIADRAAEENLLRDKKAEFEAAYEKFAGIVEQARAQAEDYNNLKIECEELRGHIEELLEQHDMDQEELQTRHNEIDTMYAQLEEALKQGVTDKQEITKANALVEELKAELEKAKAEDVVSVVRDDAEVKNLRIQLDEAKREKSVDEETIASGKHEVEILKERIGKLEGERGEKVKEVEKGNVEIQGLKIQIETLGKQRSLDLETISQANTEIEGLRARLDQESAESQRSMNDSVETLQKQLAEAQTAKEGLEKERTRKEGDIKLLREQMQGLLKAQGNREMELSRTREDYESLKKRYDELVSDRKKDEEWRHENFMELEAVRQRLADVMRIKEQESTLHQRDADAWKRTDEEQQAQLKEVSGRLAEMVLEVNGRNEVMKGLNETVERLKLADEASSVKMEESKAKIEELEKELREEKRKVAVEVTAVNDKAKELEEKKKSVEEEVEILKATVQTLEERIKGYETAVGSNQDAGQKIHELEQRLTEANSQIEKIVLEADMEVEAMEREIEDARSHAVEVAQEANVKIDTLEQEILEIQQIAEATQAESKLLEEKLAETKAHAAKQVSDAENELKKLETQIKVEEAKASATIAVANDRLAVLEKQIKTFEVLKRHKAQDESDLHSLRTHVVKIERIALQFLPLEDSGMLNAIDDLKKSHLETQQKHKKRRKKEQIMAERSGLQL
ncbi:hypothetical protein TWF694_001830 [Orbilia ellipsospora]|uniref:Uncharacterized protein n=1 Tax=Orbilia ellipsospora TaxID=2528407 RepID=A0AAV9X4V2_9PEZI